MSVCVAPDAIPFNSLIPILKLESRCSAAAQSCRLGERACPHDCRWLTARPSIPPFRPADLSLAASSDVHATHIERAPSRQGGLTSCDSANDRAAPRFRRSEEHTSELQSLMRISYAVFCLKKKKKHTKLTD